MASGYRVHCCLSSTKEMAVTFEQLHLKADNRETGKSLEVTGLERLSRTGSTLTRHRPHLIPRTRSKKKKSHYGVHL